MAAVPRVMSCVLAAACALGWAATAHGRPAFAPGAVESAKPLTAQQREERRFLNEAAAYLRFEQEAAWLALARSGNAAVRELAANLVKHHKTVQPEVLRLLHVRGMAMPMLANEHARVLKQLGKAGGAKFDRLFLEEVGVRAHAYTLRQHERLAQLGHDPVLRAWAERQLPGLRYRLAMAERALPGGERRAHGGKGQPASPGRRLPM